MSSPIIDIRNLTKRFKNLTAVDSLNLQIEAGQIFGLLGPNGAGKTTTISMLATLVEPTEGTAIINGFDIRQQPSEVRKSIGMVFQDPTLDTILTGTENMELHARLYHVPKLERKQRIEELLKVVDLHHRANDLARTYSGGMKRRLELARGLIHHPAVLFLDEPTLGLDPQARLKMWDYIGDMAKREKTTIILTTHYLDEADKMCDQIAIMDRGKIIALDTPEGLKKQVESSIKGRWPTLDDVFLALVGKQTEEAPSEDSWVADAMRYRASGRE